MKKRVISAIIALAIVIPIYILGGIWFRLGAALIGALAFKETLGLKNSHHPYPPFIVGLGFIGTEVLILFNNRADYLPVFVSLVALVVIFLLALIPSIFDEGDKYTTRDAFYLVGTMAFIGIFFNLMINIRLSNKYLLLYLFLVTTMTDTFAYIIGSLIGKHKILPKVSPKKSVEGCIGGTILGTVIATMFYHFVLMKTAPMKLIAVIAMTFFLTILGQLGDFFFSKVKRENNIKDFSNIMPGHGGILDRLDSISFVVYGFMAIYLIINIAKLGLY